MKKILLGTALTFAAGMIHAQTMSYKNTLKTGVIAGASVPAGNAAAGAGIDLAYQHLLTPHVGLGIATGYQHHFGKKTKIDGTEVENHSFGVVPIAGAVRYYPQSKGIYVGADVGYGVITGDKKVTSHAALNNDRPDGGFYLKPEIGYHNRKWNIFAHYSKVFTGADAGKVGNQKFNAGILGVGLAYNIPLGR